MRRVSLGVVALLTCIAAGGWWAFRFQTPVTAEQAVDLFRDRNDAVTSTRYEVTPNRDGSARRSLDASSATAARRVRTTDPHPTSDEMDEVVRATLNTPHLRFDVMPAEGVYLYQGSGREGVGPYTRGFPKDTHRIVTHDDRDTWTEQHVFSEQRASWTTITTSETGRLAHAQRNDIAIGPNNAVNETRTIPFNPPLEATLFPRLGINEEWRGRFSGRTEKGEMYDGTYEARATENATWSIDGVRLRVHGYHIDVRFRGDITGTVSVSYWIAPRYGLTVREEYYADAKVGPLDYFGEWFVELSSLQPRT